MTVSRQTICVAVATILMMSWGCKSQVDDKTPVETGDESVAEEVINIADLLPRETTVVFSYQLDKLQRLRHESPLPVEFIDSLMLYSQVSRSLLADEGLPGLDSEGAVFVAASRVGFEDILARIRVGSPSLFAEMDDIPGSFHFRLVAPATDAEMLREAIEEQCEISGCPELIEISVRGPYVVIDTAQSLRYNELPDPDAVPAVEEGFEVNDTAAWTAFLSRKAPIAFYGQMDGLFDKLGMLQIRESAEFVVPYRGPEALAEVVQEFTYDSPEVAESEDVVILLDRDGDIIFLDAVASLTEYGHKLVSTLAASAPMKSRSRTDAALDIRWGLDLSAAIAETTKPRWASDLRGLDESTFARMLDGQTRESEWGFPLGVFRAPITGYAMFDEFVGEQTTPAEFSMINGFWLQIFDVVDADVVAAMGLHLPDDAPMDSFEEFAKLSLLPFGAELKSRVIASGENSEFQASTGLDVADLFTDDKITIVPGVQANLNLRRVAELISAVDSESGLGFEEQMMINMVANIGAPNVYFHSGFENGQGLVRLQWGGDALIPPTAEDGTGAPRALAPATSECLHSAREWSILGLYELHDVGDDADRRALLADDIAGALDELLPNCEPGAEETVRGLAADWRALGE